MDLDAFLASLEAQLQETQIRLGVVSFKENYARVAVSSLEKKLEGDAQNILKKAIRRLRRSGDEPLQPGGDLSRGSFGRMDLSAATESGLLHAGLEEALKKLHDFATAPPINLKTLKDSLPSFYVFVCYMPTEEVVLFGRRLNRMNLARHGAMRLVVGNEGTLKSFEKELIIFDSQIDWVYARSEFLVLKPEQLEAAFVDRERLLRRTRENARTINEKVPIANFAEFEQRCVDVPGMQTRLARIVSSPEWRAWQPDVDALKGYSVRYGNVVDWDNSTGKITFDGHPRRQWNILKLLDQAFYTGELTHTQYEATGKQSVSSG